MAYNTVVPQGVAGTGNAVIYGDNPVAAQFGNQLAALRQNQYNDELLKQKRAEDLAKEWTANKLQASSGMLAASQMAKLEQDHFEKGLKLQQANKRPYGSGPDGLDYQKDQVGLQSIQGYRKGLEDQINDLNKMIDANPSKYDRDSIQRLHDFVNGVNKEGGLMEAYNRNYAPPDLQEQFDEAEKFHKNYNPVSEAKESLPVVDPNSPTGFSVTSKNQVKVPETKQQIEAVITGTPGGVDYVKKTTGLTPQEANNIPDSFEANVADVREQLDNNPSKNELAGMGIVWGTPDAEAYIEAAAKDQYQAKRNYNNFMGKQLSVAQAKLNSTESIKPYTKPINLAQENLDERKRHDKAMENKSVQDKINPQLDARKQWVDDIKNGVPGSGERLKEFVQGNPNFSNGSEFKIIGNHNDPRDAKYTIEVPAKIKLNSTGTPVEIAPKTTYKVNGADPNFAYKMNDIINYITDQHMDIGASTGLKGNVKGSTVKTSTGSVTTGKTLSGTSSDLETAAKKKGITKSEYKKILENAGYTVIEK